MLLLLSAIFIVNEPVVNMREEPSHESKVASQALYSEKVTIEKKEGDWAYITTPDHYLGWVPLSTIASRDETYETSLKVSRKAAHIYGVKDTEFGAVKTVPYKARLKALDQTDARWIKIELPDGKEGYIQKGDVAPELQLKEKGDLVAFSKKFLGLPYTWGGRSSFGYDCSGYVQMLYNQIGIDLLRDSKQQVLDPRFQTISHELLEPGDLVFFGYAEDKIRHVGMYLGDGKFIHSTVRENKPWLRISNLTDMEWSGHPDAFYSYRTFRQLSR